MTCSSCGGAGGHQMRDENGMVIAEIPCGACGGGGQLPDPLVDPINPN